MSTTVQYISKAASTLLQDTDKVRWTDDELVMWINQGQVELAKNKPDAKLKTTNVALTGGAKQDLPVDGIALVNIHSNADGTAVTPCDRLALDLFMPGWQTKTTGTAVTHFMPDENPVVYYVYPAQSATPATVLMTYKAYPTPVTSTGVIDVLDIYAENLINYVLYRAFSKDAEFGGDAARAVAYYQVFKE